MAFVSGFELLSVVLFLLFKTYIYNPVISTDPINNLGISGTISFHENELVGIINAKIGLPPVILIPIKKIMNDKIKTVKQDSKCLVLMFFIFFGGL